MSRELHLFKSAIEHARSAIIITDSKQDDDPIVYCNKAFEELTGYSRKEILGKNCRFLQGPDIGKSAKEKMKDSVIQGETLTITIKNYRKNGEPFWNDLLMFPIRNDEGEVTHFVGMQRDITEQKNIHDYKDAFIGMASHELKTPLTSLSLYSDILIHQLTNNNSEAAKKSALVIQSEMKRLTILMNSLLDATQIEKGRIRITKEHFDINELIDEVAENFLISTDTHTIVRDLNLEKKVDADREKIGQVITNLISNAVKYSPNANRVEIITTIKEGQALIEVTDYGYGISSEEQHNIFERFFRTKMKEKKQLPGFGLGLSICNDILKEHGSQLKVKSQENKGSTFSFMLPLA